MVWSERHRFERQGKNEPNKSQWAHETPKPPDLVMDILFEDNHLLVVNKPAGLATMGVSANEPSLVAQAKGYLKQKYQKPGNVYLGVVSRIDALVSGVIIFARTSKAAARLTDQFRSGQVQKTYWALVEQTPDPPAAAVVDWLLKDERQQRMVAVAAAGEGAKEARLEYRTFDAGPPALLEIGLLTGRKHQIRVQMAVRGCPILGDRKYGSRRLFPVGIALHARRLKLIHPVRHTPLELEAPVPGYWRDIGSTRSAWPGAGK